MSSLKDDRTRIAKRKYDVAFAAPLEPSFSVAGVRYGKTSKKRQKAIDLRFAKC